LQHGFFASLPFLDRSLLQGIIERGVEETKSGASSLASAADLIGTAEFPRTRSAAGDLPSLLETDELRAAMGRIACAYDGGHIMD